MAVVENVVAVASEMVEAVSGAEEALNRLVVVEEMGKVVEGSGPDLVVANIRVEVAGAIGCSGQEPLLAKKVDAVKGMVVVAPGMEAGVTVAAAEMGVRAVEKAEEAMVRMEGCKLVGQAHIPVKEWEGSDLVGEVSFPVLKEKEVGSKLAEQASMEETGEESKLAQMGSTPAMIEKDEGNEQAVKVRIQAAEEMDEEGNKLVAQVSILVMKEKDDGNELVDLVVLVNSQVMEDKHEGSKQVVPASFRAS